MEDKKITRLNEIIRFCISGGVGVGLNYVILYFLTEKLHVWYLFSSLVGFLVNVISNFIFQRFWTFQNKKEADIKKHLFSYFALRIFLLLLNSVCLYLFVTVYDFWYMGVQFVLTIVLSCISYFVSKRIFKGKGK